MGGARGFCQGVFSLSFEPCYCPACHVRATCVSPSRVSPGHGGGAFRVSGGRVLPFSDSSLLHIRPSPLLLTCLDSVLGFEEKESVSTIERVRKRKYQNLSAFLSRRLLRESEPGAAVRGPRKGAGGLH